MCNSFEGRLSHLAFGATLLIAHHGPVVGALVSLDTFDGCSVSVLANARYVGGEHVRLGTLEFLAELHGVLVLWCVDVVLEFVDAVTGLVLWYSELTGQYGHIVLHLTLQFLPLIVQNGSLPQLFTKQGLSYQFWLLEKVARLLTLLRELSQVFA